MELWGATTGASRTNDWLYCEVDMSAKIRALKTEKTKLEKRLEKVKELMDANPLGRIIEIRQEAHEILEANKGEHEKIAQLIEPLAKEEKEMFALAEKQKDSIKLVDERVRLESEIYELRSEIYYADQRAI